MQTPQSNGRNRTKNHLAVRQAARLYVLWDSAHLCHFCWRELHGSLYSNTRHLNQIKDKRSSLIWLQLWFLQKRISDKVENSGAKLNAGWYPAVDECTHTHKDGHKALKICLYKRRYTTQTSQEFCLNGRDFVIKNHNCCTQSFICALNCCDIKASNCSNKWNVGF